MKKIIFLPAMVIAISFSCNQQAKETPKNSDLLLDNLKGNVEQTVATDYKVDSSGAIGEQDAPVWTGAGVCGGGKDHLGLRSLRVK